MDEILPSVGLMHCPSAEEEMLYETIADTGADTRLAYLLSSMSDEILILAVKLYEKIPWSSDHFVCSKRPDVDVVGTLLRRLMVPECPVFTAATRALGLFLDSQVLPGVEVVILESGILRSEAFKKILSLSSSSNPWIQQSVASILSMMGFGMEKADDLKACIDAGMPQAFLILLASRHDDVQSRAISAIREFTTKGAQFCNVFFSANILPALATHSTRARINQVGLPLESSIAILEILREAEVSAPLESFVHPGIITTVIGHVTSRLGAEAEVALGSLVRIYEHVPETLAITHFVQPIIALLSSSDNYMQCGAGRAIWLIARHNNAYFCKTFLAAGVAQPLAMLFSSPNQFVLISALSAFRSILNTDGDGLATKALSDAGAIDILTPLCHNTNRSITSLARATISAIEEPHHDHGLHSYASMELHWIRAMRKIHSGYL